MSRELPDIERCPFCGGPGKLEAGNVWPVSVYCVDCDAEGPPYDNYLTAIKLWNERVKYKRVSPYIQVEIPLAGKIHQASVSFDCDAETAEKIEKDLIEIGIKVKK